MIVPVMAILNLVLTQQIYSEETNNAHAHNRDRVPLNKVFYGFASAQAARDNVNFCWKNFEFALLMKLHRHILETSSFMVYTFKR